MRLIDADAFLERNKEFADRDFNHPKYEDTLRELVDEEPTAQPEIIHCESCKHWKNEHICERLSRYGTFETPKNFYCGYGKEK